jgi:hypothetical protein
MQAIDLYQTLLDAGMTARANDGQLLIGPDELLTEDLRAAIKDGKPALLALLQGQGLDLELQDLIDAAMRVCDIYGDGEQAREDMRADCLNTPLHLRADLLGHFNSLFPKVIHVQDQDPN